VALCCAVLCYAASQLLQAALRSGALDTVKRREVVMNGPLKLVQGNFGTISRIPIFIDDTDFNETWGNNRTCECCRGIDARCAFMRLFAWTDCGGAEVSWTALVTLLSCLQSHQVGCVNYCLKCLRVCVWGLLAHHLLK
jgi:hypothetical protein